MQFVSLLRLLWALVTCKPPAVHARAAEPEPEDEDCRLEPLVYTSAAYANIMPGIYADYGGCGYDVHLPAVTEPVNPGWRDVVMSFAVSRKYGGFHPTQYPRGNEERFTRYKEDVTLAIFTCQGPRASQVAVNFVASFCAVALCEGRAKEIVHSMVMKAGKLPLKRDLYCKLHEDITTRPIQFWLPGYGDV
jgi:hypothetical protein